MITVMIGYVFGLFVLFMLSVFMTGWQTTLWFFGILHGGSTLLILGIWWLERHQRPLNYYDNNLETPTPVSCVAHPTVLATLPPPEQRFDEHAPYAPVYQRADMRRCG